MSEFDEARHNAEVAAQALAGRLREVVDEAARVGQTWCALDGSGSRNHGEWAHIWVRLGAVLDEAEHAAGLRSTDKAGEVITPWDGEVSTTRGPA